MSCLKLPAALLLALMLAGSWPDQPTQCAERGRSRTLAVAAATADPAAASALPTVHTVVATDCTRYFTW